MDEDIMEENEIKIILLGDSGVGKTSLINIAVGKKFSEKMLTTLNASYSVKKVYINNKLYKLNLWDTIGQERYRQLTKLFYTNTKIVIFVYECISRKSLESLDYWVKDVESNLGKDYIKAVVANKIDLYLKEEVKPQEGEEFAKKIDAHFLEISAKEDNPETFLDFIVDFSKEYLLTKNIDDKNNKGRIKLKKNVINNNTNNKKKCC